MKPPTTVLDATTAYQMDQDIVGKFVEERLEIGDHSIMTADLRQEIESFCEATGNRIGIRSVVNRLKTLGAESYKGTGGARRW